MAVKEKFNHSVSLTIAQEQKLDKVRLLGFSIPQIIDVGMDTLLEMQAEQKKIEE